MKSGEKIIRVHGYSSYRAGCRYGEVFDVHQWFCRESICYDYNTHTQTLSVSTTGYTKQPWMQNSECRKQGSPVLIVILLLLCDF